jgi:hypothetical protein
MAGTNAETLYSVRTSYPDVLQIGRDCTISLPVSRSGSTVAPSAATVAVYGPGGAAVVSTTSASIVDGVATYTIAAALLTGEGDATLGEGWQEVWTLTLPDGTVRTYDREAALARRPIAPALEVDDLVDQYSQITAIKGTIDLQTVIDATWGVIVRRWIKSGNLTYLVKSPYILGDCHRELALARFFRELYQLRNSDNYLQLATTHQREYERQWGEINVTTDYDHDGRVDDTERRERPALLIQPNVMPSPVPVSSSRFGLVRGGRWKW